MSTDRPRQDLQSVFIEHRRRLHESAQRIVGKHDLAEDILQAAFLRVTDTPEHLSIRQPLNYCFQVVRHLAIDHCRRRSLEAQVFASEAEGQNVAAARVSPEHSAISGQFLLRIEKALTNLPSRTREAFTLYRLEGLTQRAIATRLGVSPTLVNFMIRDAVDALKNCRDDDF